MGVSGLNMRLQSCGQVLRGWFGMRMVCMQRAAGGGLGGASADMARGAARSSAQAVRRPGKKIVP